MHRHCNIVLIRCVDKSIVFSADRVILAHCRHHEIYEIILLFLFALMSVR